MTTPATRSGSQQIDFSPIDTETRRIITERLDETLFVEASAGTGKTACLVSRVVNMVTTEGPLSTALRP